MLHQITTTNTAQTQCYTSIAGNRTQISTKKSTARRADDQQDGNGTEPKHMRTQ